MLGNKGFFVITRRDFIKMSIASAAALGFSPLIRWPKMAEAALNKPAVVWLEGQDCAGCTESVISLWNVATITTGKGKNRVTQVVTLADAILDVVNIRYHETIMAGSGDVAEYALDEAMSDGGYILVVEGSMPGLNKAFLEVAGHPLEDKFYDLAKEAGAIAAIGACGAFGGIPRAGGDEIQYPSDPDQRTQGQGVGFFINRWNTENPTDPIEAPLVNIPGCPVHPVWFWDTAIAVIDTLVNGAPLPNLDPETKRPTKHFGARIHDSCPRKKYFDRGQYLEDWNNKSQKKWCLKKKGCRGEVTWADCNQIKWNDGANCCIDNCAPCAGCTEPDFYNAFNPLYQNLVT